MLSRCMLIPLQIYQGQYFSKLISGEVMYDRSKVVESPVRSSLIFCHSVLLNFLFCSLIRQVPPSNLPTPQRCGGFMYLLKAN